MDIDHTNVSGTHGENKSRRLATALTTFSIAAVQLASVWALGITEVDAQTQAPATAPVPARPILIQFSHVVAVDTAKGRAALKFKELAEARTGGQVRVEVYPNSQLYKDREELDALSLGAVQMLAPALSKFGGDFEALDLPFLFTSHAQYRRVVDGPIGARMLQNLESRGFRGLAFWDNGFKVFTANRPLQSVQDFKGLRIRVQASKTLVTQMKQLGSEPSVSSLSNVHEALRSGKLDGQENTPINIASQHLHDVQTHLTVSNHGYLAYAVVVNKYFWDKLPADIRTTLEGAMRDATAYENSLAEADNIRALKQIEATGKLNVYVPDSRVLAQWRQALVPVYQTSEAWIDPALISDIEAVNQAPP